MLFSFSNSVSVLFQRKNNDFRKICSYCMEQEVLYVEIGGGSSLDHLSYFCFVLLVMVIALLFCCWLCVLLFCFIVYHKNYGC